MKRIIILLIMISVVLLCMISCQKNENSTSQNNETDKEEIGEQFTDMITTDKQQVRAEEDLKEDLTANSQFTVVDGSIISEVSIIKRQTDEDDKSDRVWIQISIDHEAASEERAYIMHYTLYNEGWILDSIEEYYGDDAEWSVAPKNVPSNEVIMEELIAYSNMQIDMSYEEQDAEERFKNSYFFEEGKYTTTIYTGEMISDTEYICLVHTERCFNNVIVDEEQRLHFELNMNSYNWTLVYGEITDLRGTWYIEDTWQGSTEISEFSIDEIEASYGIDGYTLFLVTETISDHTINYQEKVAFPSSHSIDISNTTIFPDAVYCKYLEDYYLVEDNGVERIGEIDFQGMGIVDYTSSNETQGYQEDARKILEAVYLNSDISEVKNRWHPNLTSMGVSMQGLADFESIIDCGGFYGGSAVSLEHKITQIITSDDEIEEYGFDILGFEWLKSWDINASEIIVSCYSVELKEDEGTRFVNARVVFAKENDQIYIVGLP